MPSKELAHVDTARAMQVSEERRPNKDDFNLNEKAIRMMAGATLLYVCQLILFFWKDVLYMADETTAPPSISIAVLKKSP